MKITCFSVGSVDFCKRHTSDWPSGWPRCQEATNKEPVTILPKAVTAWLQSPEAESRLAAALHQPDYTCCGVHDELVGAEERQHVAQVAIAALTKP